MEQTFDTILTSLLESYENNPAQDIDALIEEKSKEWNLTEEQAALLKETNGYIDGFTENAASLEEAKADGIELHFVNTGNMEDPAAELIKITGGTGFDDVFCYAPVAQVVELSSAVLGRDGCLNFFAGPTDNKFSAKMNFYDVHYNSTHRLPKEAIRAFPVCLQ